MGGQLCCFLGQPRKTISIIYTGERTKCDILELDRDPFSDIRLLAVDQTCPPCHTSRGKADLRRGLRAPDWEGSKRPTTGDMEAARP